MLFILLCFVLRVLSEVSVHNVHVSRKSRSNSEPFETGYVYTDFDNNPGTYASFDTEDTDNKRVDYGRSSNYILPNMDPYSNSEHLSRPIIESSPVTKSPLLKRDLATSPNSKFSYNSGFLPSKIKTDAMYEHLKSTMHYKPPIGTEMMFGYESDYHVDDDDIRTSSRGLHDSWPYYYYNPNEYDHMRIDVEKEKAKDKRYAVDAARIIPIHEDLSDDIPYSQEPLLTTTEFHYTSTDNPISGHDPFFSVLLNDYSNKNYDYHDQLTLKGLNWNDGELPNQEASRYRRLPSEHIPSKSSNINHKHNQYETANAGNKESEKGIAQKQDFKKHEKGDTKKANDQTKYHQNELKQMGFKDFVDNFANKFGSEDHKKDSKFVMKINQDKGENRKGFRRVYHKDEYQEDNEFYDNNNKSAMAEDKGSSNMHIGGSEGLLKSTSLANIGNQGSAYDKSGDTESNMFENNHDGYDNINSHNTQFHRYRDVAKQAAQSNDADYRLY